jgi:hypothetical protein
VKYCLIRFLKVVAVGFTVPIAAASRPSDGGKSNSWLALDSSARAVLLVTPAPVGMKETIDQMDHSRMIENTSRKDARSDDFKIGSPLP